MPTNLSINSTLLGGKYRIESVLGQGGFGITYMAVHTILNKRVAIKEFFPKEYCDRDESTSHITLGTQGNKDFVDKLRKKFIKEAQNISRLNHKNIIQIQDIFEENHTAYYVMHYIDGASLEEIVAKEGPLEPARALKYVEEIADALRNMHSEKMMHLDVKPANIMIRRKDDRPVLIDFGLSKAYSATGGQTSTTPHGVSHGYSPLEQYNPDGVSKFSPQTDIYSLGATLLKLISGNTPPDATKRLEQPLSFPENVNPQLRKVIEECMALSKSGRPENMDRVLDLIATVPVPASADVAQVATPVSGGGGVKPPVKPNKPVIAEPVSIGGRPVAPKKEEEKTMVLADGGKIKKKSDTPAGGKPAKPENKLKKVIFFILGFIAIAAIVAAIMIFSKRGGKSEPALDTPVVATEETAAAVGEIEEIVEPEPIVETPSEDLKKQEPDKPGKEVKPGKEAAQGKTQSKPDSKPDSRPAASTPAPADNLAAVKLAASSVTAGNLDSGLRCTGASLQGKTLVFNVTCNTSIYDAADCTASNPVFRHGINAYIASTPTASAAVQVARSNKVAVRFHFSGARSFSINY